VKKGLFIFVLVAVCGTIQGSILDQSQEQIDDSWLVVCGEWSFAQTFTAGVTGQLEKVDLYLENMFAAELYPTTVSIVSVMDEVPSGSVLGTVFAEDLTEGFNSIDFLGESVFLVADTQYGIMLFNDDSERYAGPSTQWLSTLSDVYSRGALWTYIYEEWTQVVTPPGGGPDEIFYDKDAAFRTYMVPEPTAVLVFGLGAFILRKKRLYRFSSNSGRC